MWRKHSLGTELRLELDTGEITAKIGQRRPEQSVKILLPDGQIEDLGTVLSLKVEAEHTVRIRVLEGRVRVRLNAQSPFELGAGDAWSQPVATAIPAQASSATKRAAHARSISSVAALKSASSVAAAPSSAAAAQTA